MHVFHQRRSLRQEDAQECQMPHFQARLGYLRQSSHDLVNPAQNSMLMKTLPSCSKHSQTGLTRVHTGSLTAHIRKLHSPGLKHMACKLVSDLSILLTSPLTENARQWYGFLPVFRNVIYYLLVQHLLTTQRAKYLEKLFPSLCLTIK